MDYRMLAAFGLSFVISVILYKIFIPILRKVKLGQKILEIGPAWHKCKEGTPVLGGLFFIAPMIVVVVIFLFSENLGENDYGLLAVFGMALAFGLIGFIDDYVKLFKKRNKGLSATQKLVLQFLVAAVYLWINSSYCGKDSSLYLPIGDRSIDLGVFYYFAAIIVIVYMVNCSNLTDGIDGLLGTISVIIGIFFFLISFMMPENNSGILTASLVGALIGFLIFNLHPAKIIMGDTGALYLGGFLVGMAFYFNMEVLIFIIMFVWLIEGVSDILQVGYYKLTQKRIFKMAPIHHHFEMCGWSEFKIVTVFPVITAFMCGAAYFIYIM
ncbi:MAG: phospho-N-acetylmuramoyl-pentapeptide-transferase [Eubacteriales bacterium]|nr:phospho-N-acetylmuramoyl-pentapeptide-transferase [Eubacteriales bacterium]